MGLIFILAVFIPPEAWSRNTICNKLKLKNCPWGSYSKSSQASHPTQSGGFNFNPSSIPTDKGIGVEVLNYNGDQDYALVTGTGRIGAAISPSNYEDSFFGNMSFEADDAYLGRKRAGKKYTSEKYSFATAVNLYDNKKKRAKTFRANAGLIAKYNNETSKFNWGAGLALEISLFSIGISRYKDDYLIIEDATVDNLFIQNYQNFERYEVETFTFGIKLPHVVADYTYLLNKFDYFGIQKKDTITLVTMTVFWRSWMFTLGTRKEVSFRPFYNFKTELLETKDEKHESFFGSPILDQQKLYRRSLSELLSQSRLYPGINRFFLNVIWP